MCAPTPHHGTRSQIDRTALTGLGRRLTLTDRAITRIFARLAAKKAALFARLRPTEHRDPGHWRDLYWMSVTEALDRILP